MENDYFLNSGIQPPLRFGATPIPTWQSRSPAPETSFRSDQSLDCLLNQNWDNFDSALSSMASSPAPSTNNFAMPELIGKLSNICNSGEITPESHPLLAATAAFIGGGNATHKPHFMKASLPSSGNSTAMNSNLPAITADPGFAERAAKFSSFGSRSFNGRTKTTTTTQLGLKMNNAESPCYRSNPLMANANLPRVSSTPSLIASSGSSMANLGNLNCTQTQMQMMPENGSNTKFSKTGTEFQFPGPNDESSVLEQKQSFPSDSNSKKRKPNSRGKSPTQKCNSTKVAEAEEEEPNTKRSKTSEDDETKRLNTMEESKKEEEPFKDYIHVRARRGQATDSHSLAERVRREKISERMKLLQDLVPGCNKVTGKALMLDEIINYVQSLQRQVEFLSMKVASVNTRPDFNMDGVFSKDVFQGNGISAPSSYLLDSSMSSLFGQHRTQEIPQLQNIASKITGLQLPHNDEYSQGLPQFPTLCEDDLQSIVQMGFIQNQNQNQNQNQDSGFDQEGYPGTSQTSHMKAEL